MRTGEATPENISKIHERMKPLRDITYTPDGEVQSYEIVHPNSHVIRNEHSTTQSTYSSPDGKLRISYTLEQGKVTSVYIHVTDFFFPQSDKHGEWWHNDKHDARDYGYNETEYGFMHTLRAEQKGSFFPQGARDLNPDQYDDMSDEYFLAIREEDARKIKLFIFDTMLMDFAIRGLTISRISLERGDLTTFFKHIDYDLLDKLYALPTPT